MHCLMLTAGDRAGQARMDTTPSVRREHHPRVPIQAPGIAQQHHQPCRKQQPRPDGNRELIGLNTYSAQPGVIKRPRSRTNSRRPKQAGRRRRERNSQVLVSRQPRVAGMAALVIDALGDNANYSEPHQIAKYLRDNAAQYTPGENGFISTHPDDPSTLTNQDPQPALGSWISIPPSTRETQERHP